jgi:hypothetical protein
VPSITFVVIHSLRLMNFTSYIYKPNPKKIQEDRMSWIYLGAAIVGLILIYVFFIRGMLALAFLGAVGGGLIKLKIDDIKKKGANRFGSLPHILKISAESITIGNSEFRTEDISSLELDATDFTGGPGGDVLSSSTGTDNFLEFHHNGEKHSYQFLVKRKSDLAIIASILKEIQLRKVSSTIL